MAIIKKRLDQLQPGDVIVSNVTREPMRLDRHTVSRILPSSTPGNYVATLRTGGADGMPWQINRPGHVEFDVEVPDGQPMVPPPIPASEYTRPAPAAPVLTPAQQHADALFDLVQQAVRLITPSNGTTFDALDDWHAQACKLLDAIAPQPPTLDEALATIARLVADGAGGRPGIDAERLLDQARRAGVMK